MTLTGSVVLGGNPGEEEIVPMIINQPDGQPYHPVSAPRVVGLRPPGPARLVQYILRTRQVPALNYSRDI